MNVTVYVRSKSAGLPVSHRVAPKKLWNKQWNDGMSLEY